MNKKHIITITGDLASGKSTITHIIKDRLNYSIYQNGEYFRKLAAQYNMNVLEFGFYVKDHPQIDEQIELSAKNYAEENDNIVIDAKLGFYSVPNSFKVYVTVDTDEAARRVFADEKRGCVECYTSVQNAKQGIIKRYNHENERWFNLYGVKKNDMTNYDFVIDSTNSTPQEVADKIIQEYEKWLNK
ncbi:MAG: (d)CMP kinase [Clostridia bacterium]|nr:(d)CMP kinase [Clostridia bacterium]